jgi:hypothetical protein
LIPSEQTEAREEAAQKKREERKSGFEIENDLSSMIAL